MRSLALAVIAASIASSVAAPASEGDGVRIPLAPRKRFVKQNGVANIPLLQKHLARTIDKVSRGFDAFESNTGAKHPLDTGSRLSKRATGADPLTDDDDGELWQGAVSVGSPAKGFTGMSSTSSSDESLSVNLH